MKCLFIYIILFLVWSKTFAQQGALINHGALIVIDSGSSITLSGKMNYINDSCQSAEAFIELDGHLNISGDWHNTGNTSVFKNIETIPNGIVTFNSSSQQDIYGPSSTTFENLNINSSHGVDAIKLLTNTFVAGKLYLTNNGINTTNNSLILTNTDPNAITVYDSISYIIGELIRYIDTGQYVFPVGRESEIEELIIDIKDKGEMNYIAIQFTNESPGPVPAGLEVGGVPIDGFLDAGYWVATADNTNDIQIDISATSRGHTNGASSAEMHSLLSRSETGDWESIGSHSNLTQSGNDTLPITAVRSNSNLIGDFAIGYSSAQALPVSLLHFDTKCEDKTAYIQWSTASETNNDYFTIAISEDATHWQTLNIIEGQGNSNTLEHYTYVYTPIISNKTYIRLEQTDYDGKKTVFETIKLRCDNPSKRQIRIKDNPVHNTLHLGIENTGSNEHITVYLYDLKGHLAISQSFSIHQGNNNLSIPCHQLKPGVYQLVLLNSKNKMEDSKKIVLQ